MSSSYDAIGGAKEAKSQGLKKLKHLPHWPPVNIDFEDVTYTVENGIQSKYE
jgi:hypothetical protein